jgi:hypothetical protein
MPLKTIAIKFSDPEIPFEAASELLSKFAYPEEAHRQRTFGDALCRFEHLAESKRNPNWAFSAHQIRPRIFVSGIDAFAKNLHEGWKTLDEFLGLSLNIMIPHVFDFLARDDCEGVAKDLVPGLNKIVETILDHKGRSRGSRSTVIADVWVPLRPVFHLAFAYAYVVFFRPVKGNYDRQSRPLYELITPYPAKSTLLGVLEYAEIIMSVLSSMPSMNKLNFREDETIKFVAET